MRAVTDSGRELDAQFSVVGGGSTWEIVFESRGGSGSNARNRDYSETLETVLRRLGRLEATLLGAELVSREAMVLPIAARRLAVSTPYPIALCTVNARALRLELGRAQQAIHRPGVKRGGNRTKRVLLRISTPFSCSSGEYIERVLAHGV